MVVLRGARVGLVVDQLVLEVAHLVGERPRRVALRVEVEVAADQRHQPLRVGGVVDRERRRVAAAEPLDLGAQDPHARRVERRDPHRLGPAADERGDPLLHLARGLVGEGDRQDLAGLHVALGQQVGDAVGEHPGLARAGAGDDQQRAALVDDRRALLRVEPVEQRRSTAWTRSCAGAGADLRGLTAPARRVLIDAADRSYADARPASPTTRGGAPRAGRQRRRAGPRRDRPPGRRRLRRRRHHRRLDRRGHRGHVRHRHQRRRRRLRPRPSPAPRCRASGRPSRRAAAGASASTTCVSSATWTASLPSPTSCAATSRG